MDYLDYLQEYEYDELPDHVKVSVERTAYNERRSMVRSITEPAEALPDVLRAAFSARTQDAEPVLKSRARWLPWLAAAGWLLFIGASFVLMLRQPVTKIVEKTVTAPAAPPEIVYRTDTVYRPITKYRYRTLTVHDTVHQPVPYQQLVLLHDTIYLAPPSVVLARGSSSLRGKERVLDFLFSTE